MTRFRGSSFGYHNRRLGLGLDAVLRSAARVLCGRGLGRWSWFWIRGFSTSLPLQNFA